MQARMSPLGAVKNAIKRTLYGIAPKQAAAFFAARSRAHSHRMVAEWGLDTLNRKLVDALGTQVLGGPFKGMTLSPMTMKEHVGPYLLGTYEAELHAWLNMLVARRFTRVIDVGSKFGYYAVGFARSRPGTEVIAFDTDWWARRATKEVAHANGVAPDVRVEGFCSPSRLRDVTSARSLVISDCEGYESELFAQKIPALDSSTLLIELHEAAAPGVTARLRDRFAASHSVSSVSTEGFTVLAPPVDLRFLTANEARAALREIRLPQEWLLFEPRVPSN